MLRFDHRQRSAAAGSLTKWTVCILIMCVIALLSAGTVFADDLVGADAHSPSMTAGSGEEPIADESTTKDYVSTDVATADNAAVTTTDNSAADQAVMASGDSDAGEDNTALAIAESSGASDGAGKVSSVLKGVKGFMSGIPAIVLFAFAMLTAALLIVLLTIKKSAGARRRRGAYVPRH